MLEKVENAIVLRQGTIDGKPIAWSSETEFLIQIGKGSRGSYKTKYSVKGDLGRALMIYNGVNIGNGYKKRLLAPGMNKPLLARAVS